MKIFNHRFKYLQFSLTTLQNGKNVSPHFLCGTTTGTNEWSKGSKSF